MFPFFHKMTLFLGGKKPRRALSVRFFIKLANRGDFFKKKKKKQAASVSENNNRKMKPSGMKMEEDALFSRSFERGAQTEPDSLVRISLQTGAPQPNVSSEGRKCVNNICSRVQIQMEPVAFTWLQCSR